MTNLNRLILPQTSAIVKTLYCTLCSLLFCNCSILFAQREKRLWALWPDEDAVYINAQGGGILGYKGKYYKYGGHKRDTTSSAMVGVTCYSHYRLEG